MSVAIVAEPIPSERARCVNILANQPPLGALGVSNWEELLEALRSDCDVDLIVYSVTLPGAPDDALDSLASHNCRLAVVAEDESLPDLPEGASRQSAPIQEEMLILLASPTSSSNSELQSTFRPLDLIQVLCMSNESQVLVITHEDSDVGVIELRDGMVWTAYDSLGVGEASFARMMNPAMRARPCRSQGCSKERTIFAGTEELILDSLRLIDQGEVSLPPPLSKPVAAMPERRTEIMKLELEARRYLTERNYSQATKTLVILSERDPSSKLVLANLAQLHSLGYPDD